MKLPFAIKKVTLFGQSKCVPRHGAELTVWKSLYQVYVEPKDRRKTSLRIILGDFGGHFRDRNFVWVSTVCRLKITQGIF